MHKMKSRASITPHQIEVIITLANSKLRYPTVNSHLILRKWYMQINNY